MCSVIILNRPLTDWPIMMAANRDELLDRPFLAPGRYWPDHPEITAGMDLAAGGTWLGFHDNGLILAMLNRQGSLGPLPGKRSRGLLAIDLLACGNLVSAREKVVKIDPSLYRPFNAILADSNEALWVRFNGESTDIRPIPEGYSMLNAQDLNDPQSLRIQYYLPRFREAARPAPGDDSWSPWAELLFSQDIPPGGTVRDALFIRPDQGYGTSSSALLALSKNSFYWQYRTANAWRKIF